MRSRPGATRFQPMVRKRQPEQLLAVLGWSGVTRTDRECSPASPAARADAPARKSAATAGYAHRPGRQAAGDDAAAAEDDMDRSHRPVQRQRVQERRAPQLPA